MPIDREEFEQLQARDLSKLAEETLQLLEVIGTKLGFSSDRGFPSWVGNLDLVWYIERSLPGFESAKIPIVGFEIETSWRNRKHMKGDIYNLQEVHPALGVIILLRKGFDDETKLKGLLGAVKKYAQRAGFIQVWTEDEIDKLKSIP